MKAIMYDQLIHQVGGTVDLGAVAPKESELRELERKHGMLPDQYRDFLLQWGGAGLAEIVRFPIGQTGRRAYLGYFYGSGPKQLMRLDVICENYSGRIESGWLPFAGDGSGNQICVRLADPGHGQVGFWDHNQEEPPEDEDESKETVVTFVADSLEAFLRSLQRA